MAERRRRRSKADDPRRASGNRPRKRRGSKAAARPASLRDLLVRRNGWYLWGLGWLWMGGLWLYPESTASTRFSGVVFASLLALGWLALWWRYRVLRWGLVALYLGAITFWFLPGRDRYDRVALREAVARALREQEGRNFLAEGENARSVGAKGLFRRGLVKGTCREGISTLNPLLVRRAWKLWWSGGPDPWEPPRRELERLVYQKPITGFDPAILYPGDLARTTDRAMIYLGDGQWIEASPTAGKVIIFPLPGDETPLSIWRWRFLKARRP